MNSRDYSKGKSRNYKLIELANDKVSVWYVLNTLGIETRDSESSKKVSCPFGFYHSDGGKQRTLQVFSDNKAYCYACSYMYTPVSLRALAHDLLPVEAAKDLLDSIGYKPQSVAELWVELEKERDIPPDRASLGQALRLYLGRVAPDWNRRQFDSRIAHRLDECFELLNLVQTESDARKWLAETKVIMASELNRKESDGASEY